MFCFDLVFVPYINIQVQYVVCTLSFNKMRIHALIDVMGERGIGHGALIFITFDLITSACMLGFVILHRDAQRNAFLI